MPATPKLGLRYPNATDAPDGPGQFLTLATDVDNIVQDATANFAGTITTWGAFQGVWVRKVGAIVVLNVNVNASGLQTGGSILGLPTGYHPPLIVRASFDVYSNPGAWAGARAVVELGTDGILRLNWSSVALGSGFGLFGSITFPV